MCPIDEIIAHLVSSSTYQMFIIIDYHLVQERFLTQEMVSIDTSPALHWPTYLSRRATLDEQTDVVTCKVVMLFLQGL